MKLNHKLLLIKISLLFVIFSLSFFVIDSTFINLYAAGPGGKMITIPKIKSGIGSLTAKDPSFDFKSSLTAKDLGSLSSHFPYSKNIQYSKPEIKNEIEKKLEKIKLNKPNLYTEQKT